MKTLRKNIDLDSKTVVVLQVEGSLKGHGTLKPFIESIINEYAQKAMKSRPSVYQAMFEKPDKKVLKKGRTSLKKRSRD